MRFRTTLALRLMPALLASGTAFAEGNGLAFHGAGWVEFGRIEKSYTPPPYQTNNYLKNWLEHAGGLISMSNPVGENWEAAFGMGAVNVELARGARADAHIWYPFIVPFVSEARVTYTNALFGEDKGLRLTLGAFPYGYSSDTKNLGFYLLRGYVYPGAVVSGFEIPFSIFGASAAVSRGGFHNEIILKSENEDKPLFDFSLADVASWQVAPGIELGAGVNFYRLIKQNPKLTSPGKDCDASALGPYASQGQENPCFIIDTVGGAPDTVTGSLSGTKLMARAHLDPKAWFGAGSLGKDDLVLYAEAAILGLKDYPKAYDDIKRRIPVMVGFNFPVFGALDYLSLEVEYYATKNSQDMIAAENGSWVPAVATWTDTSGVLRKVDYGRDDWKWSLNAAKVMLGHTKVSTQVANDHTRLGGSHNNATGREALSVFGDWYWMLKIAYFF